MAYTQALIPGHLAPGEKCDKVGCNARHDNTIRWDQHDGHGSRILYFCSSRCKESAIEDANKAKR